MTEAQPAGFRSQVKHVAEKATSGARKAVEKVSPFVEKLKLKAEVASFDQKFSIASKFGFSPDQQRRFDIHFSEQVQHYRKNSGTAEGHVFDLLFVLFLSQRKPLNNLQQNIKI